MRLSVLAFLTIAFPIFVASASQAAEVQTALYSVADAFLRATPAKISAGYVVITNPTAQDDVLTGAAADWAGRIELHRVEADKNGVMAMKPVHEIPLPAHGAIALRPGAQHLMIYEVKEKLVPGQKRTITLTFRNAGSVNIPFTVRPLSYKGIHH